MEFKQYEIIGDTQDFVDKANSIDTEILSKGPIAIIEKIAIGHSILLFFVLLLELFTLNNDIKLKIVLLTISLFTISVIICKNMTNRWYSEDPMQYLLNERHKRLQNKHEERYIVYLNLLHVLTKESIINLDNNMFKVRGSNGNWKFKEISIGDIKDGDNLLIIDVENLKCWSECV